jgi:hypothetical protein
MIPEPSSIAGSDESCLFAIIRCRNWTSPVSEDASSSLSRPRNALILPLAVVSVVAVLEAAALVILLLRQPVSSASPPTGVAVRPEPAPVPPVTPPAASSASPTSTAAANTVSEAQSPRASAAAGVARGKVGERVASAGFGITVEKIYHEPQTYKDMVTIGPQERYLALLIAADNNTGGNAGLYPSMFQLQDSQGFGYDPLGVKGTMPTLEWRTMGNRETVRGHIDFVIPKSAKGLTLVYSGVSAAGAQPIHVELGE